MVASQDHLILIAEAELIKLIASAFDSPIDLAFGPGWVALVWRKGDPLPAAVQQLAKIRGVS